MIVLSFDTSLAACSAAVVETGKAARVLSTSFCQPGRGHAEILLGLIGEVMSKAGVGFADIERQIVTIGPGSFTGVRVALSAARGFRLAHNIPICSLNTMQAISANISKIEASGPATASAVIIDARRHEVYGQVFDGDLKPLCTPALIKVDDLGDWLQPWQTVPLTLLGSGADLAAANGCTVPQNWVVIKDHDLPDARRFAMGFRNLTPDGTPPDPIYLRQPDAKPQIIGQVPS